MEPGSPPLALAQDQYQLTERAGRLLLEAWNQQRNTARRLIRIAEQSPGKMVLAAEALFGRETQLTLTDAAQPRSRATLVRSIRDELKQRFHDWLTRQFPGWRIVEITTGADLEHSLSPVYPRALLARGRHQIAALCSPPSAADADAALTFGLIWLDYVRRRRPEQAVGTLALFIPSGFIANTTLRLRYLDPKHARWLLFHYDETGFEEHVDFTDRGNWQQKLDPWRSLPAQPQCEAEEWARRLAAIDGVELIVLSGGRVSLRVRGLEFALLDRCELRMGVEAKRTAASYDAVAKLARELAAIRQARGPEPHHPWRLRQPERWVESMVRRNLSTVDAALLEEPVYGQVSSTLAEDRGIADLLAMTESGRLAVIELKATEDPHLPLQALDYWIRVKQHHERGEIRQAGYFPLREPANPAPLLYLVAPALSFHPTTETILRAFASVVQVRRIGLDVEWQQNLRVVFRASGSSRPDRFLTDINADVHPLP